MKHLSKLLVTLFAGMAFTTANAQSESQPWAIKIGANAVDFFNEEDTFDDVRLLRHSNWNIIPSISELSISRYIKSGLSASVGGSFNKIDTVGNLRSQTPGGSVEEFSYFSVEGKLSYDLRHAFGIQKIWFAPYIGIGGGYNWLDDDGDFSANFSAGADFWITENFALSIDSTYKGYLGEYDNAGEGFDFTGAGNRTITGQRSHMQHSAGIKFAFGGKDTDGDGITDNKDECPETFGLKEFNGCPDSDSDGIKDSEDACPQTPQGPNGINGCPDDDKDGIVNKDDACPKEAGTAEMDGCPDSDGDGVANNTDQCPEVPGPVANNGCPYKDSDNDGVLDKDDKCPDVAGVKANNGCPEVKKVTAEVQKQLNNYAKTILFDTGKSTIKAQSQQVLTDIIAILNEYPKAKFEIDGHTDSVGSAVSNQKLSDSRASSVMNYLIKGGIGSSRLTSKGFGESSPIAPNTTKAGRASNRRVEINLIK